MCANIFVFSALDFVENAINLKVAQEHICRRLGLPVAPLNNVKVPRGTKISDNKQGKLPSESRPVLIYRLNSTEGDFEPLLPLLQQVCRTMK